MDKNFSTKEMLDSILEDTRTYKSKLSGIKFEVEQKIFSQDTEFMRSVSNQQAGRKNLLSSKIRETEELREKVRRKKSAAEIAIKNFYDELKR